MAPKRRDLAPQPMENSSEPSSITLRDIAKKLGISHSTVSRALQNSSSISPARRTEIHEAAQKMGYRPNAVATLLGHQRHAHGKRPISSEIAWINFWPQPELLRKHLEFDLYWKGARARAEESGYRLEEFVCNAQLSSSRLEKILLSRNIHGILIPPHGGCPAPQGWERIDWGKFSIIRLGYSVPTPKTHLVTSNQVAAGQLAVENMVRLGYKRIGFVTDSLRFRNFRAGFFNKQADLGEALKTFVFRFTAIQDHFSELPHFSAWMKENKPDAILTDVIVTREMLAKLGYAVPGDIGLAATSILDGNADAGINQNSEEIGKAAFETLLSLLTHNQYGVPKVIREVLITGTWVDGGTLPKITRPLGRAPRSSQH